jgi:hypothetical protein
MVNGDCNGIYTRLLRLCGFGDKYIYMGIVEIPMTREIYAVNLKWNLWYFSLIIVVMEIQQCDHFVLF